MADFGNFLVPKVMPEKNPLNDFLEIGMKKNNVSYKRYQPNAMTINKVLLYYLWQWLFIIYNVASKFFDLILSRFKNSLKSEFCILLYIISWFL